MMRRHPIASLLTGMLLVGLFAFRVLGQKADDSPESRAAKVEAAIEKLPWAKGPGEARLSDRATIPYGSEFRFLSSKDAVQRLKMSGNRVNEDEILGLLEHKGDKWWVVFQFEEVGYVKDDEKNDLNADKLLDSYKKGVEADNEERDGSPTKVIGWHVPPSTTRPPTTWNGRSPSRPPASVT